MPGWVGLSVAAAVVLVACAAGVLVRRRDGRFRATPDVAPSPDSVPAPLDPTLAALGVTTGTATLLQFSSAFCAPCRAARVYCAEVARTVPGVRHLEVDAESHLDAVRALEIWRTPTVLIVDASGTVRRRASGAMDRAQILAAVAEVVPANATDPAWGLASAPDAKVA